MCAQNDCISELPLLTIAETISMAWFRKRAIRDNLKGGLETLSIFFTPQDRDSEWTLIKNSCFHHMSKTRHTEPCVTRSHFSFSHGGGRNIPIFLLGTFNEIISGQHICVNRHGFHNYRLSFLLSLLELL